MAEIQAFDSDPNESLFEEYSHYNGAIHWLASDLARLLGYDNLQDMRKAISKAQKVCLSLSIPIEENFIATTNSQGDKDTKLSRFACYLTTMNADIKKPEVARAQYYFAAMAESFRLYLQQVEGVVRVELRSEVSDREKSLIGVANDAGVEQFAYFQNAGYRGMYNMNLSQLRSCKQIPSDRSPLDFMGKTELAANLFRITQTEEKIKAQSIRGQGALEAAAEGVGREVRNTMMKISGTTPESLPTSEDIKSVQKQIKQTHRKFKKLDKPSKKKIENKKLE